MGRARGLREAALRDIGDWQSSGEFSALERTCLALADAMTGTPAEVPAELIDELKTELDDTQIVELVATVAWENHRSRFNRALGIEADDFSEGAFCPLPVRALAP